MITIPPFCHIILLFIITKSSGLHFSSTTDRQEAKHRYDMTGIALFECCGEHMHWMLLGQWSVYGLDVIIWWYPRGNYCRNHLQIFYSTTISCKRLQFGEFARGWPGTWMYGQNGCAGGDNIFFSQTYIIEYNCMSYCPIIGVDKKYIHKGMQWGEAAVGDEFIGVVEGCSGFFENLKDFNVNLILFFEIYYFVTFCNRGMKDKQLKYLFAFEGIPHSWISCPLPSLVPIIRLLWLILKEVSSTESLWISSQISRWYFYIASAEYLSTHSDPVGSVE